MDQKVQPVYRNPLLDTPPFTEEMKMTYHLVWIPEYRKEIFNVLTIL